MRNPISKRFECLLRGHQKAHLIKRMKLDGATVEGWPNFRVLESADVCRRCGKKLDTPSDGELGS